MIENRKSYFFNILKILLSGYLNYCDYKLLCFSNANQFINRTMFHQFSDPVCLHVFYYYL